MDIKRFILIIIPSTFTWCLAATLLLIYSFDVLDYVEQLEDNPFMGFGIIILAIILLLVILVLYFTGHYLDSHPEYLKKGIMIGMLGASTTSILFVVFINSTILFSLSLIGLAFFFAILLTSSGTVFAGLTESTVRGKTYASAIFILLVLVSIVIGNEVSSNYALSNPLSNSWAIIIPGIGGLGLILAGIFFLLSRDLKYWIPDAWPTKFTKIVGRRSVQAYLSTHFLLYCMLGIAIAIFPLIGSFLNITETFEFPAFGEIQFTVDKVFWILVLIGDLILVLPAGILADKIGRKNLIVLAIYGIVFSALILGLERSEVSFIISALTIGFSFALIHPTLDSSLWADLSPRDGLGRYYALGFISLAFGLGAGYGVGHWILRPLLDNLDYVTYVLIILAV